MRYADTVTITSPLAGIPGTYLFRANSIYDPDYTGAGHQPYGHDTYATIYNHYRVVKSTITATPLVSPNSRAFIYGINKNDDATVPAATDIMEQKGVVMAASGATPGQPTAPIVNVFYSGYYKNKDNQSAPMNTNPGDPMFFCVFAYPDATDTQASVKFIVTITYDVLLWELKDLGQS